MNTVIFLDHLTTILYELVFPALAAWGLYMMRTWLKRWMRDDDDGPGKNR